MSLVNSRQHHSMFLATGSNRGFEEMAGMILHEAPVRELLETEAGQVKLADGEVSKEDELVMNSGSSSGSGVGKGRKKVIPWTDDEHLKFLDGLKRFGKGAWAEISKQAVVTKTPKQVTSHAQKYYLRQDNNKKKKRRSIHDVTIEDVLTPTTSSPSSSYGSQSVTPTPRIQDIASTTVVVEVEPPPLALATAGFNDIVKGKGVLSTPYPYPNYLYDYYYSAQTLPMNYCQVGEASQPVFNLYDTQGEGPQPLPMNYYQVGEASQAVFNLYDTQGGGGEVQPPLATSLYDIGKGKGVLAESASYLCDGHYYYGGQVEGPQPPPMNYFSGGQVGEASQPPFNLYDNQGEGAQPLPMNYCQVGEASQPLFNLYDTQGKGGEVQPPLATSLYDTGKGIGELAEITSLIAPYMYDGQCFGGQGEGTPPLPMNYCQVAGEASQPLFNLYDTQGEGAQPLPMNYCQVGEAPQPVFNLYDSQGGGELQPQPTFFDYDEGALVWNEYSYDNSYYYLSDYY